MKIQNALVSNILDRSQRYFAHVTTVTLSWRVQNIVVIGRVYLTLECFEFSSNFEFDRNMLSGTGAWYVFFRFCWSRDKMAAVLQTTFLNKFSCVFCFNFPHICSQGTINNMAAMVHIYWLGTEQLTSYHLKQWCYSFLEHIYVYDEIPVTMRFSQSQWNYAYE